ncbi:MAG: tetratricopeptide (TPR) repeat protein [Pseudoalteromonas rhizosphaerae]|jgi:tetratricopeptide (TPR) repeat protein|uniref:Tetratricopeptide repeat protein n=1 Tax=Pseudoalteromonas neustonica TaxID=1840331 RepID=A0ABY3FHW9_9GAMM|nr:MULTISPECIES: tetratricopeptide repeat protein [Pseudoalteromonas]MBB1507842.1 tetratricopeptide repeat protein [Pseudoalteromonas sp. SG41-1]TVU84906.1 tetratricopeptide repeat protein [Pseudoalteromonas neustonica]
MKKLTTKKWLTSLAIVPLTFYMAASQATSLQVKLQPSDLHWQLLINNNLLSPTDIKIEANERSFAQQLKPLLQQGNYQAVADLFKQRELGNDSPALQLLRGQVLLTLKQFAGAEQALKASLSSMPDLVKAHQGLSLLYMQQGNYQQAQPHLTRCIELGQADAQVYAQLAYIHVQAEQPWSAIAAYRQALMLEPQQAQYQQGLLFSLIAAGDLGQAQALLKELLNASPNNPELWLQRAQIALQQDNNKQALASIEVALKLAPSNASNQLLAAQLHLTQGSYSRSVELLSNALASTQPAQIAEASEISMQTLNWLIAQKKWQLAKQLVSQLNPFINKLSKQSRAEFSVYTAQLAIEQGNFKQAQKSLHKALTIDPNLGDALLSLANIYQQQNQLTQARLMYVRAQALPEYQLSAWLGLAQIEIENKNYKEALSQLKKALNANPQRQDLLTNIRALEGLIQREG